MLSIIQSMIISNVIIFFFLVFRKGKVKPLEIVEKDMTGRFVHLFTSMGDVAADINIEVASEFVCIMYGQTKQCSVDDARYSRLMQMTGKVDQVCCKKRNRQ